MVPNGWDVKSPSKLFKLFSGFAFKSSDAKESGAKWLKIANVGIGEIKWDADSFLPEHYLLEHKKYLLTKGDIVVALTRPTLGNKLKVARLTKDSDTSLLNQRVAKIVCKENVDSEFTFQVLRSDQFAFRINVGLLGTDPPNLSVKVLEDFTIPVPPLPEQRKIAQILSTWDRGIATTEKLIDASKQQKKALMQQLLTGKKRLLDPETGSAFEGEWEEVKLKEITQFIKDGTHGTHKRYDKGVPMLSAVNITKNHKVNFNGAPNISHDDYNKIHSKYEIDEGDILLTVVGTIGRVALVPKAMKFTLQRSVAIIRTSNKASNQFLMQVFSSNEFNNLLMSKSNSTAQAGVYLGELAKIKLLLPLLEEQEKIASVLTAADKEIELLQAKLAHFKQEKKALMQQLLTGKKRVNLAQTMEVTV